MDKGTKQAISLSLGIIFFGLLCFAIIVIPKEMADFAKNLFSLLKHRISLLVLIGIGIGVFLLLREFWCWYWKINERIKILKKIEENTRKQ